MPHGNCHNFFDSKAIWPRFYTYDVKTCGSMYANQDFDISILFEINLLTILFFGSPGINRTPQNDLKHHTTAL